MSAAKRAAPQRDALLRELEVWAGRLSPGLERRGTIFDQDVEVEISVRVRHRAAPDAIAQYRGAALDRLKQRPYLVRHCGCGVKPRHSWVKYKSDCTGRVVAAVVYQGWNDPLSSPYTSGSGFLFICGRHRETHGVDPKVILAVVELPPSLLAPLHEAAKTRQAEQDRKYREEEEARERERTRGKERS